MYKPKRMPKVLIVSPIPALTQYIEWYMRQNGVVPNDTIEPRNVSGRKVRANIVYGILPYWAAALTRAYYHVNFEVPNGMSYDKLSYDWFRKNAVVTRYYVHRVIDTLDKAVM